MSRFWTLGVVMAALFVGVGCGDNIGSRPDAVADASTSGDLFGWPCPIASIPGTVYPCHYSAPDTPDGWCVQPPGSKSPTCRPMCRDLSGKFCASIGGVVWQQDDGNGACVCVPG